MSTHGHSHGHEPSATGAPAEHRAYAPKSVRFAILTVSDSRRIETDGSGRLIRELIEERGYSVADHEVVKDDADAIRVAVLRSIARVDVDAVIATGGTGISPRDVTPDAVEPLLEKVLPGFGELFRWLSFEQIGAAAALSRALAGTVGRKIAYVMPGSTAAVRLCMTRLVLPEVAHAIGQLRR